MKSLPLLLLLLLFLSCSSKSDDQGASTNINDFKSYSVDVFKESVPIANYIESVEVIGLEETDSSLVGNPSDVHLVDSHIVFRSGGAGDIFIFTDDGKFKLRINETGEGPREYRSIWNLWTNGSLIEICEFYNKIVSFDLNGEFVKSNRLEVQGSHYIGHNDQYFSNVSSNRTEDSLKYHVAILDENLQQKDLIIPYPKFKKTGLTWGFNTFTKHKGKLYYQNTFGDTLYHIENNQAEPVASIDFGDDWIWKDESIYENTQAQRDLRSKEDKVLMYFMHLSDELIYFTTFTRHGVFLLNRNSGAYQRFYVNKEYGNSANFFPWQWVGDEMIAKIGSLELRGLLSDLDESQFTFAGNNSLEQIESSENPVILKIRF